MSEWKEAGGNILYSCWGKMKKNAENPEKFVVFEKDKPVQGVIEKVNMTREEDGTITDGNFMLKTKEHEDPILVWVNASIKNQIDELDLQEGDEVQVIYSGKYKAKNGKDGNGVKIRKRVK